MELKLTCPYNSSNSAILCRSMKKTSSQHSQSSSNTQQDCHGHGHDQEIKGSGTSSPLSSTNISKLILPPLGVSSYNQAPFDSKGWIISPMDSRYRYTSLYTHIYIYMHTYKPKCTHVCISLTHTPAHVSPL